MISTIDTSSGQIVTFAAVRCSGVFTLLALLCLSMVGCGEPLPPDFQVAEGMYPVVGELRFRGDIAPEATLRLHPTTAGAGNPIVSAVVDSEGKFQIFTFRPEGKLLGATPGQYKVTVSWQGITEGLTQDKRDELKELVPVKYHKPQTTPLILEVVSGDNQIGVLAVD